MGHLAEIVLLLGVAVTIVVIAQRLHIPTSLGYLLVGVLLGPYTLGPSLYVPGFHTLGEFGVVFLLFTIGLNFSLPQLHALRHEVLGFGTGQVLLTTAVVAIALWLAGLPAAAAFVFGAVFAQSSTTIIASQLAEQGEQHTQHGRVGLAMSVFQDVTAVPFLVIIPVLSLSVSAGLLATALGWALAKAVLAIIVVIVAGRWLLRPLFHLVTRQRSAEVFTLAVLLIALLAAWATSSLGLSLAFGAFLVGMMLGETEFRHQVESSIRPFRDVLLGLFFVGVGMRVEPAAIPPIWHWCLLGALLIVLSKTLIVTAMLRTSGTDLMNAWRTGLLLAVGGEFGLALVAIALDSNALTMQLGQIALTSVLFSMIVGAILIRFNGVIATFLARSSRGAANLSAELLDLPERQVVIGGYGRVGHTVAVLLHARNIPFIVFDTDAKRVAQGRAEGHPISYGDISDSALLDLIHIERAALVVLTIDEPAAALQALSAVKNISPTVPVIARAHDIETSSRLLTAGAIYAYPETIEASLSLGATALEMLQVDKLDAAAIVQEIRDRDYEPVRMPPPYKR